MPDAVCRWNFNEFFHSLMPDPVCRWNFNEFFHSLMPDPVCRWNFNEFFHSLMPDPVCRWNFSEFFHSLMPDPVCRWNFNEFFHSLMLIFRILCGEWIEPLWDCMRANGEICMIVFLPTLVFGNFMVSYAVVIFIYSSTNTQETTQFKTCLSSNM